MQSNSHFLNRDLLKLNLRNYRLERSSEEANDRTERINFTRGGRERKGEKRKKRYTPIGRLAPIGIGRLNKPERGKSVSLKRRQRRSVNSALARELIECRMTERFTPIVSRGRITR